MRYEREFEKLERRGPDYDELLRSGSIMRRVENPDEWRAEMRAKVRSDKLHIRTGGYDDGRVWAALIDREVSVDELGEIFELMDLQSEAAARATLRGHETNWLRVEGKPVKRRSHYENERAGSRKPKDAPDGGAPRSGLETSGTKKRGVGQNSHLGMENRVPKRSK